MYFMFLQVHTTQIPHHTIQFHTIQFHTIPNHTTLYHTPYHTIQFHTILYHTIPYHTTYHSIPHDITPYITKAHYTVVYYTIPVPTIKVQKATLKVCSNFQCVGSYFHLIAISNSVSVYTLLNPNCLDTKARSC